MPKRKAAAKRKPLSRAKMDALMDSAMKDIAKIHAENDGTGSDWVFHQAIRFIFDGYPHHAGPLFRRLEKLEGNSLRVQGLRLIFKSETIRPTPFGNLCPKPGMAVR
jgi:hypothetical protein